MNTFESRPITAPDYELAEGVLFDDAAGRLRWVDIWRGRVLSAALAHDHVEDLESIEIGQTAGAVALAADGGLLVAGARGLVTISPTGSISVGPDLLGQRQDVRLNDGSVDPQGRFVVGTLALGAPTGEESLLRISADGRIEILRELILLSNGIGFSPNGDTILHVDTLARTISRHSYSPGAFDSDEAWVVIADDFPHHPDGLCMSSDGSFWVAQWGGGCVQHHAPTGELLDVVTVDASQVSCPAFVGPALDMLAITTAQEGLSSWTDRSGAIFLANVNSTGLPAPRWSGSTIHPYWHDTKEADI